MKNLKKLIAVFLVALFVFSVMPLTAHAAVKLNKTKVTLMQYEEIQLKVKGTKKKVTWSSNNKKVANVTKNGLVYTDNVGKATITAKVGNKKYKCKITVKKRYSENGTWKANIDGNTWYFDVNDYTGYVDKYLGVVYIYKNKMNDFEDHIAYGEYYKIGINKYRLKFNGCIIDFKVSAKSMKLTQKKGSINGTKLNGKFTLVRRHYS